MPSRADRGHVETPPDAALVPTVAAVWSRRHGGAARDDRVRRILPDGSADLVLGFAPVGPDTPGLAPAALALTDVWVVGTMRTARVVDADAASAYVGVRLRPEAAGRVLGVAAHALVDERLPLDAVWPGAGASFAALARVPDLAAARAGVQQALLLRLTRIAPLPSEVVQAVQLLEATNGRVRIGAACDGLGVSRQHLARQFARHVGLAPKAFARVARLRALDADLRARERCGARVCWSTLAYAHGYADQPHLVDEVRELTGLTPGAWLRERRAAAGAPVRSRRRFHSLKARSASACNVGA
ncbi:MAG TPA: helix-turn-helix domain-containing protein [Gemmatirosa sp.]